MAHTQLAQPGSRSNGAAPAAVASSIDACDECASACLGSLEHCLIMGGEHASPDHIGLILDCAEMCQTAGNFGRRGSDLRAQCCALCAEACDRCAASCEQFGDDEAMGDCAAACRNCAAGCRTMAALV